MELKKPENVTLAMEAARAAFDARVQNVEMHAMDDGIVPKNISDQIVKAREVLLVGGRGSVHEHLVRSAPDTQTILNVVKDARDTPDLSHTAKLLVNEYLDKFESTLGASEAVYNRERSRQQAKAAHQG